MTTPPSKSNPNRRNKGANNSTDVNIYGDLHYQANDIAELRKLADSHPDLAAQISADRHKEFIVAERTERLGMALAVVFGVVLILGTSWTLVKLGWWQSLMFVAALLGISHVLRTVLKGEFSDTSWFGKILTGKVKPPTDSEN